MAASMLLLWASLLLGRGVFCMQHLASANIEEARASTEFNASTNDTRPRRVHRNFHRRWHQNNQQRAMRKMADKNRPALEELEQHELIGQHEVVPAIVTAHASVMKTPAMTESHPANAVASASLVQSHMDSLKRYAKENPAKFAVCIAIFFFVWIIGCVPTSGDLSIKAEQRMMKHAPPVGSTSTAPAATASLPAAGEQRSRVRTQSH